MIPSISENEFGTLPSGESVKLFTLRNSSGAEATFVNLGAAWMGFKIAQDQPNLVLGCQTLEALLSQQAFFGATVGRYANRVGKGQFQINGIDYQLEINQSPNHLHGGAKGFHSKVWNSHIELVDDVTPVLTFTCFSEDGESGFPGNVEAIAIITLTQDNTVRFEYKATTDKPTIINMTNHAYFNLDGCHEGNLANHEFKIESTTYLESDENTLATGKLIDGKDTPFDFSDWSAAAPHLDPMSNKDLIMAEGYDHCYCFEDDKKLKVLASAKSDTSGRTLVCKSDLPGVQLYTGNFLEGTPANETQSYHKYGGFCLEPGYWTDSPNHAHFPDCVFDSDKSYSAIIEYSFT